MAFDAEDDGIILLVLVVSGVTNLLNILSKSRRQCGLNLGYIADQQKVFITTLYRN